MRMVLILRDGRSFQWWCTRVMRAMPWIQSQACLLDWGGPSVSILRAWVLMRMCAFKDRKMWIGMVWVFWRWIPLVLMTWSTSQAVL